MQSQKHHQDAGETQLLSLEEPVQVHGKEVAGHQQIGEQARQVKCN